MFFPNRTIFLFVCLLINHTKSEELGYCAPYNGKICKAHISGVQVWYPRFVTLSSLNQTIIWRLSIKFKKYLNNINNNTINILKNDFSLQHSKRWVGK